ncbi:helicase C-terminal domain-containing protein [Streptomyces sp. NBC_01190]|uniref:helicase C-terminal domain-containing protein n=1 Tax=Streptomyces sp. NBC_01190 TaxID=2903767 RepID=UPI003865F678|nr:helicase C-terminal domain-containing protein [Streptomyces sp. NBC_01190]
MTSEAREGAAAHAPRTLAEDLRARDDAALALLLRTRPDLLTPVPTDLTQLATRAVTRASVLRALEHLDTFTRQVAEALAISPDPCGYASLRSLLTGRTSAARGRRGSGAAAKGAAPAAAAKPPTAQGRTEAPAADTAAPDPAAAPASTAPASTAPASAAPGPTAPPSAAATDNGDTAPAPRRVSTPADFPLGDAPLDPAVVRAITDALPAALAALRVRGIVWGGEDELRLVRTARDVLAPSAAMASATGLGPAVGEATAGMSPARLQEVLRDAGLAATHDPVSALNALAGLFGDPERLAALLARAPEGVRGVLERLVWGPPYGEVRDANVAVRAADAVTPVQWLLARGVLLPSGPHNVVLPREAALTLRGGRAHRTPQPTPPEVTAVARTPRTVDLTAAGQALTAVRIVTEVLTAWQSGGPPVLRAGGISVRELRRTAGALDLPEQETAFWLELAYAAGLIATDGELDEAYAPTPAADDWRQQPAARQWVVLAGAWLTATRTPGLVGSRDPKNRALSALGPDLDRSLTPQVRRRTLRLLAELPPGSAADQPSLLARLRWERPLRAGADAFRGDLLGWTLNDAETLGITGRGALAAHARPLLDGGGGSGGSSRSSGKGSGGKNGDGSEGDGTDLAAATLAPLLPEPLDHVLLQADLTAVAPGPLIAPLAETLGVLADIESKGGATVYRFTPESVRRALDAGRSASELQSFLTVHSRTPVPQPLSYLIDDVARRHGTLRVGAASAYLRCDDDALLTELLADRRASGLGLRRLAPTVVAAQTEPSTLLDRLRAMGLAPAAESAEGDVVISRPDARRTPPRTPPVPVGEGPPVPQDRLLGAAVKAIRAGDRASTAVRRASATATGPNGANGATEQGLPRSPTADSLATIQAAVLTGSSLWIGYVNAEGAASQRVIAPVRVEGGYVTAYDHNADEVRTFPLHRITGVSELADDPA